jgi:nicotinamide-nucleotide amidase
MVGDEPEAIKEALKDALGRADFVLVTGGLGATDDDITAGMAAEVFGLPLAQSQRMVKNLREFWESRGLSLPEGTNKMAWLPQGAEVLCPTCAGFCLTGPGERPVYFLPGVPQETRHIIDTRVLPDLLRRQGGKRAAAMAELRVFGLSESEVQKRLADLDKTGIRLGYYPEFPEVRLVAAAWAEGTKAAQAKAEAFAQKIRRRLGGYVFSAGGESLEEVAAKGLIAKGLTLALAESITGGLIGHRLTQVAGSSAFFERGLTVYSNRAKEELLGVKKETLAEFGAVSAQTAGEMALGACQNAGCDLGLSVTGIAGPAGGSPQKPVGTVYFGLARGETVRAAGQRFFGDRQEIKLLAAATALDWLRRYLEDDAFLYSP